METMEDARQVKNVGKPDDDDGAITIGRMPIDER